MNIRHIILILYVISAPIYAAVTPWIDIVVDKGHVKIPIEIAGINTLAMLDSGAQTNVINKAFIGKNQLDLNKGGLMRVKGVHSKTLNYTYNNVPITLFGVQTNIDSVVEASFGHHSTGLILGAGFFEQFIVQIDYPNKKMRLLTRDTLDMDKVENLLLTKQKGSDQLLVKVGFGHDLASWFIFDTGNSGGLYLERDAARRMELLNDTPAQTAVASGVNGAIKYIDTHRAKEVTIGPYTLENVVVSIPEEGAATNLSSQYSSTTSRIKGKRVVGILGYDILKHFVFTLDYKSGKGHIALPQ